MFHRRHRQPLPRAVASEYVAMVLSQRARNEHLTISRHDLKHLIADLRHGFGVYASLASQSASERKVWKLLRRIAAETGRRDLTT